MYVEETRCWFQTDIKDTSSVLYDVNKKHQVSLIRKKDWLLLCVHAFLYNLKYMHLINGVTVIKV